MRDPERLVDHGGTDVERWLLRAGRAEEPSRASMHRAAATLGLGTGLSLVAPGAAAVGEAAGPLGLWTALKWLGVGLLAAAGLRAGVPSLGVLGQDPSSVAAAEPRGASSTASPGASHDLTDAPPVGAEPALEVNTNDHATSADPGSGGDRQAPASPARSPAATGSLRAQTAIIDTARRELGSGRPESALRQLAAYRVAYPRGVLEPEATLLRIEALAASGQPEAARRLAKRMRQRRPTSQYSGRLESVTRSGED